MAKKETELAQDELEGDPGDYQEEEDDFEEYLEEDISDEEADYASFSDFSLPGFGDDEQWSGTDFDPNIIREDTPSRGPARITEINGEKPVYKGIYTGKYTADTQPRDARGRFRQVLARLKVDLGDIGAGRALDKIQEVENLDYAGNYGRATEAAGDLLNIIDRLDVGALNPEAIRNVRESSRELGRVMANLPFAFGEQAEKIRFSDLPPALRDLIDDMITRVEAKIGKEDADVATKELKSFMSGSELYSQGDISSQMAKMLRLLT